MGARGPVPKRSTQRRRTNAGGPLTKGAASAPTPPPEPDPGWHPIARALFDAISRSGQSVFYEPTDWGVAVLLAESISRELHPQPMVVGVGRDATIEMVALPPKGASFAAWLRASAVLLLTEGDRRRVRLELERPDQEGEVGGVSELDEYRRRLGGAG